MEYLLTGSETSADPLSDDEQEMLSLFRSLSSDGRSELLSYARYKASTQEKRGREGWVIVK